MAVFYGDSIKINKVVHFHQNTNQNPPITYQELTSRSADVLLQELALLASEIIKLPVEELDINTSLSEYGFDSISFTAFSAELDKRYAVQTTPALFFTYSTLKQFSDYFWETYNVKPPLSVSVKHTANPATEPDLIAIIGMAGVFPQSPDLETLWTIYKEARI